MSAPVQEGTLDTNSLGAVSSAFDVYGQTRLALYLYDDSGSHTTHKVVIQASPKEGADFVSTTHEVTGLEPVLLVGILADSVRLKVLTAEGSASSTQYIMISS